MEQKVNYLQKNFTEAYKGNQAGFLTRRPDEWIFAVEKYCCANEYIWEEKTNNDGNIFECIINTYSNNECKHAYIY